MDLQRIYEVKTATIANFGALWLANHEALKPKIASSPGVAPLFGRFTDVPAVIVGAGPSLDKNRMWLHAAQGKAVIIAVDTIFKSLADEGIAPTFTVTLDPQPDVARFFAGASTAKKILVVPSIAHPATIEAWKGETVFYNKFAPDIPVLTEIARMNQRLGYLIPGGSVLTVGLDLAFRLGCPRIAFIGQDLSFPHGGAAYAGDTIYEDISAQDALASSVDAVVEERDIFGRPVRTRKSFSVSKQWMEWAFVNLKRDQPPAEFYNCSESGIVTRHCHIASFSEWVARYCVDRKNIDWSVKKAFSRGKR
ncbi:MAG: motility associated factor glycosyltransferase family protein [Nitrospinae bacterium]|nr:motility associated factor glycosyltransferase family protein [Nitrospinota bacterium]